MVPESEILFEHFCEANGLVFKRVATASNEGERRPDYRVTGHDETAFFAEIKEVTPNAEEEEHSRLLLAGGVGSFSTTPGARVREFIAKANPQLRAMTKGLSPGLLIIYNNNLFLRHHTEPYAILTAMRGLDVVPVLVPRDPSASPQFQDVRSGPKKRMTPQANTSIAAIVTPQELPERGWVMSIYHNRFAACPLPASALAGGRCNHFRMREDERGWQSGSAAV